jgi:hypothetical protein
MTHAREDKTFLISLITHCDQVIESRLSPVFSQRFRFMTGQVYANLLHYLGGHWVNVLRFQTGAEHIKLVSDIMFNERFSHLACYGIVATQEYDPCLLSFHPSDPLGVMV